MFAYIWPLALVVLSNVVYHISSKSTPENMNPLASLTITYLTGAIVSGVLYYILNKDANILREAVKTNWAPFALGVSIVGLEAGFIYAYRAGWTISTAQIVQSAVLALILILIGVLFYKETLTWKKIAGVVICLIGLVFINMK